MDVILVDENDVPIGKEEKQKAHLEGRLHRAFSVFVFNSKGEMLLQKRSVKKYHSGGLWTNSCCSHPVTEDIKKEAEERLKIEMGIACKLEKKAEFIYIADVGNNLIEHEYDHIFTGVSDDEPVPDKEEADGYMWIDPEKLKAEIEKSPEEYTPWLRIIIEKRMLQR